MSPSRPQETRGSLPTPLTPDLYPFPLPQYPGELIEARVIVDPSETRGGLVMLTDGSDSVAIARSPEGFLRLRISPTGNAHLERIPPDSEAYVALSDQLRSEARADFAAITDRQPRLITEDENLTVAVALSAPFEGSLLTLEMTEAAYRLHLRRDGTDAVIATLASHREGFGDVWRTLPLGIVCAMATRDATRMVVYLESERGIEQSVHELLYIDLRNQR